MNYKKINIKNGITLHEINTEKFKVNSIAVFLTTPLNRENVTKNALIPAVLRRGSKTLKTQEEISKKLEDMYGASFNCGLDKNGDNQVLKFYMETINDNFLPNSSENILRQSLESLLEIVFCPIIENSSFKKEYVIQEKNNLKQRIEGKIDNKASYALDRCIEEMYKDKPYGLYKFGYIEDLEDINEENLYQYYKELIEKCKIDIFVSGIVGDELKDIIENNNSIMGLKDREAIFNLLDSPVKEKVEEKIIEEKMDVTQGKLNIGLDLDLKDEKEKYDAVLYNSILGGSANSKLFQNVREKAHLCYVASSSYLKHKSNIFVKCGIEIENYEKALELIRKQIDDMEKGDFTEEEIENAKKGIIAQLKTIDDEQDTQITYYFGQELTSNPISVEDYTTKIQNVGKEDIINVAKKVSINTVYFLRN
ncbi:MAG: insulinase family protein [Clostridia bacterium]|nr:insulinase family protein [Clostridia bacterium]